ncbi:M20 family metallopeptidase [Caldinitratiruptor microaerophilus]|uniref:Probable succinyl-diaminopimelate desuccinylase n=1 Tax=Caldinitratiruptor microaerophilus TaxID=671077 RepID=A0AA35G7G1_9FIRM|nr:M20 family metallopeptidase [Caldinitratiruptor microaerophilus]BDG59283.1 peptidase M20 [Caldinitratiruptor microaerophilus]
MAAQVLGSLAAVDVVALCQDLIRIRTVNPPGDEGPAAEYVARRLREAGLEVEVLGHGPGRASVIGRLRGSGGAPALLLSGHLDTVPVGDQPWSRDPFAGEVADGRIWGRGAADMKGGVAAMLAAVEAVAAACRSEDPGGGPGGLRLQGDLLFAATAGEEVDSLGAAAAARRLAGTPVQAIVIGEPSGNDVYIAEKGALWLELVTHGRTAHGSSPELGRNAVMMMVTLLAELDRLEIPHTPHPLLGTLSRSVGTVAGGVKTNVVPDRCVATVDMRTVPGQDHGAIVRAVEGLIADLARRHPGFRAEVRVVNDRRPVVTDPAHPAVQAFLDAAGAVRGRRPEPTGVRYYTDATELVPVLGAPMIICGPGDPRLAHQPDESVEVDRLVEAARIYALAAVRMLAGSGSTQTPRGSQRKDASGRVT